MIRLLQVRRKSGPAFEQPGREGELKRRPRKIRHKKSSPATNRRYSAARVLSLAECRWRILHQSPALQPRKCKTQRVTQPSRIAGLGSNRLHRFL